ncbi:MULTISPECIES: glycosyltransferase family 4 protein [unclassified Staphylococcus]|uniref:glycosyltransferase family 4 protein n=1 Tax=Mammaliicoccus sciuri TaxID=1296 RepID=UPI001950504D
MHILLIHQFYLNDNDPGGSRFNKFVEFWSEKGHKVSVIAGTVNYSTGKSDEKYKNKYITKEKISENVTVYRCHVSKGYNKNFLGRLFGYFSFNFSSSFALQKIKDIDVILVSSPPLFIGLTGILAKWITKKPLIFEVRDLWPESAIDTGVISNKQIIKLAYKIEKICYRYADLINVLTPAFRDKLIEVKKIDPKRIIYIPNGADLDIFKPDEKEEDLLKNHGLMNKFIVTYTGAHGVANHLEYILNIAERMKDYDKDIHFLLIGDGMRKNDLISMANKMNLDNVSFIDAQPKNKISKYVNLSDACIAVLKNNDTFKTVYPNKIFDYMSCKKPILLGIDGVARELVEDNKAGIYINTENLEECVSSIISLKNNRELRKSFGENGYKFVSENFDRRKLADKYIEKMNIMANK